MDFGFDIAFQQKLLESISPWMTNREDVMDILLRVYCRRVEKLCGQMLTVQSGKSPLVRSDVIQVRQFFQQKRSLQLVKTLVAQVAQLVSPFVVVSGDNPRITQRSQVFSRIKAEAAQTIGSSHSPVKFCAM